MAWLAGVVLVLGVTQGRAAQPGEPIMAWHVASPPTWFDPSTAPPQITPFGMLYALHDALVRPLPGQQDGRESRRVVVGEPRRTDLRVDCARCEVSQRRPPPTADVEFSYERYRGAGAKEFPARVRRVDVVDPLTVRVLLKEPWPDFMTLYGSTATAAGLVVPKKYLTQVGDEGFRKQPIGAGPYKFVSHTPGVEVVLEAYAGYWRHAPYVKRLVMRSVPDGTTRAAVLKTGEADIAYALDGTDAENVRRDPRLQIVASKHASINWLEFADQWDPKSPWSDKRLRLAVNHAVNRQAINEAACLGFCPPAGVIVPRVMDFALQVEPRPTIPERAKQLLAEAGYPNGLDAGDLVPIPPFFTMGEAVVNYLNAVGIRTKMRPMERATFYAAWREKKLRGLFITGGGTRATRPAGSRSSSSPRGPTPTAAIPTSTTCSSSRPASAIPANVRPCSSHPATHHRPGDVRAHHGLSRPDGSRPARHRAHHHVDPQLAVSVVRRYAHQGLAGRRASPASDRRAACRFSGRRARSSARASGRRAAPFPEPTR